MFVFLRNLLLLYLLSAIVMTVAVLLSISLNEGDKLGEMTYSKFFTLHLFIMVFLFIVPAIPSLIKQALNKKEEESDL